MESFTANRRSSSFKPVRISHALYEAGSSMEGSDKRSFIPVPSGKERNISKPQQIGGKVWSTPIGSVKSTPSSLFVTTPGSSMFSMQKIGCIKDTRNFQDKEFVKETALMVQLYFQNNCPEVLVNGTDIKPMTTKMFIEMMNHLFQALNIKERFDKADYIREVPKWMELLKYPNKVLKGWLQTVNVPQYWPNVVALLSWLVILIEIGKLFDFEVAMLSDTNQPDYLKLCLETYQWFINNHDDQVVSMREQYLRSYGNFNDVDDEKVDELNEEYSKLQQLLEEPEDQLKIDALEEINQQVNIAVSNLRKIEEDINKATKEMDDYGDHKKKLETKSKTLDERIEAKKKEVEQLKKVLSEQPMSIHEQEELRTQSEFQEKENNLAKKNIDIYDNIILTLNRDIAAKKDQLLQLRYAFKRDVIYMKQKIPALSSFEVLEGEFSDMFEQINSTKSAFLECLANHEKDVKQRVTENENFKKQVETFEQEVIKKVEADEHLKVELNLNERKLKSMECEIQEAENQLKSEIEKWTEKLEQIKHTFKEYDEIRKEYDEVKSKSVALDNDIRTAEEKVEAFWMDIKSRTCHFPDLLMEGIKAIEAAKLAVSDKMTAMKEEFSISA